MRIPHEVAIHLLTLDLPPMSPPQAPSSQTGVSSDYAQLEGYDWFVLRATYNRVNAAVEKAKKNGIKTYVPQR